MWSVNVSQQFLLWNALQRHRLHCSSQQPASRSVFLICLFSLCFSLMRDTWKTSPGSPTPCHSDISSCLCYSVFFSFAQVFHAVAILLYQLSKPEAKKTFPQWNQLPAFTSPFPSVCLCPRLHSTVCLLNLWLCLAEWTEHAMWLSSPQGIVQVSRLWWSIQAQSVTNGFGWSAGPQGTLFHHSVGTWQQSPQELFKGEKFYQSQPVLLHAHPSPLIHTLKPDGVLSVSASSGYSRALHPSPEQATSEALGNKNWKKHLKISVGLD